MCNHDEIKCVNCVKYCLKCGAELPKDFIPGKAPEAAETPAEPVKKTTRKKVQK